MNCNKDVNKDMTISNQTTIIQKTYIRRDYMLVKTITQHDERHSIQPHYTNS